MKGTDSSAPNLDWTLLPGVVNREVQKIIQRQINGLEYVTSSASEAGQTPRRAIYGRGRLRLYHYVPQTDEIYRVPIVLVMSLVSKAYILDLAPGQSLIEFLVREGFDVYLIDWGVPRPEDKGLRLEDYVLDFIPDCFARVCADSGEDEVSVVAYCMGGMLSLMHAALHRDGPVKNIACFATPVDFDEMGLFRSWTDPEHFNADQIVDALGNVPAEVLLASFDLLRPASKVTNQIRLWDNMWNNEYVTGFRRIDRWSNDQIPMAGETFRQMVKELMQQNKLVKGTFKLGGQQVDLANVEVPILHAVAEHDHVVPYGASKPLISAVGGTEKEEKVFKGGHASLVAGPSAIKRMWPHMAGWLAERST